MANEGAVVGVSLFFLTLLGLVAAGAASQQKDAKKRVLLERIDKEAQEAKEYLKKDT